MNLLKMRIFITSILLFVLFSASSQDLVVTTAGDSINAEITKVSEDYIHYAYIQDGKIIRTKRPKSEISSFLYIFYSKKREIEYTFDLNDIDIRIGFSGGGSWGIDGPPDEYNQFQKTYVRRVNSGWSYKLEGEYFFKNRIGVGLNVERFFSKEEIENVIFENQDDNTTETGTLADDIQITYLGPLAVYHLDTRRDNVTAFFSLGAGFTWYRNDFIRIDPRFASGSAPGIHAAASMDFTLLNHLMMGVEVSATYVVLSGFDITDENGITTTLTDNNDISRVSVSLGFRIVK